MLSRTAENLFWFSRYIERADATVRLLELNLIVADAIKYKSGSTTIKTSAQKAFIWRSIEKILRFII